MSASELPGLNHRLGSYVRNSFGLDSGNQALRRSCAREAGKATVTVEEASAIIIGCLVLELQMTHKLRAL